MKYLEMIIILLLIAYTIFHFGKKDTYKKDTDIESFAIDPEVHDIVKNPEIETKKTNITPKFSNRHLIQMKNNHVAPVHQHDDDVKLNPPQGDHHDKHHNNQHDSLFENTIKYDNIEGDKSSGMNKCKQECKGNCIEFGITNNAMCFM